MFSLPRSMAPSCLVFAAALPKGRRYLPGQGLAVPVAQLPGSRPRTPMGSLRSSGDPSRAFAPFPDPGRTGMPSPSRSHRCCPRFAHSEGFGRWLISGLTGAASAPAVLRFVFRIAAHTQGSLPAGRLGLCREGVEPSGPLREVSARVDDHPHPALLTLAQYASLLRPTASFAPDTISPIILSQQPPIGALRSVAGSFIFFRIDPFGEGWWPPRR